MTSVDPAGAPVTRLREGLRTLRERGSMLLVAGEAPSSVMGHVCAEMGGRSHTSHVTVDTGCGCQASVSDGNGSTESAYIRWESERRGATAARGPNQVTDLPGAGAVTPVDSTTDLAEAVRQAFDSVADLDPACGSVRLCMGSPLPLVEAASEQRAFHALHLVGAHVRKHRGIGHVHLPMDRRSELVRVFEPLFDVTVEVETFGGEPRQRWYLHEEGLTSNWLPVGRGADR